jgi:hypothetical protein
MAAMLLTLVHKEARDENEIAGGPYANLNASLILGQSRGAPVGAGYTWLDEDVESGTTYYWLEDLDAQSRHAARAGVGTGAGGRPVPHLPTAGGQVGGLRVA